MAATGESSVGVLFHLLRSTAHTTRTNLVRESGLSKATVSEAIALLIAQGFLSETGKRQQGRGRSQVVIELNAAARLVIGIQFSETGCHAVLADLRAGMLASVDRTLSGTSPDAFVEALCQCVEELSGQATAPILGVGVGVPGLVDPNGREVVASVPYGWNHVPIADMLEPRIGLPVIVANRAKAAALGEYWQGGLVSRPEGQNLAYIHVGSGIVAGFVINGSLYFGSSGASGEIGHITIIPDGPLCGCGNHGCLHMLASESAIIRDIRLRSRQEGESSLNTLRAVTMTSLLEEARAGNPIVVDAVTAAGKHLGVAVATVLNLMNPSIIVIGGSVAEFGAPLLDTVRVEARQRALWEVLEGVPIVTSTLGDDAGTLGAAALFLDRLNVSELLA